MLVVVALVLFDQEARFDAPALAGAEVAALMDIVLAERLAGESGVAPGFGHGRGLLIDPLPAFLTDHHVQFETLTPVRTKGIVDGVDPEEALSASSPAALHGLRLQGMERAELLPDGGQILVLEHDHERPVVVTAALHHRPVGVESVEQEQNPQAGEAGLEALAQARKGAPFAILLLHLGFAQGLFEELAEQRDDQAVVEGQAGLEDVDEVLSVTGFVLADGTLQEFLRPEGVASGLL